MFDLVELQALCARHGPVARVVVASTKGSTPREVGAAICVWRDGQAGTIGGGRLEFQAVARARAMLDEGGSRVDRAALGPAMNQCCGGAVTVITEVFESGTLTRISGADFARAIVPGAGEKPAAMARAVARNAALGLPVPVSLSGGWLVEPLWQPRQHVVIYGAGHVGMALAKTLAPLPNFCVTLADNRPEILVDLPPRIHPMSDPDAALAAAPDDAAHLIMTHAHDLDLALCHAVLGRRFTSCGLIGSATKWARFRKRLAALGHAPGHVARIMCPIGDPALGKHPQAIAVGVVADLIRDRKSTAQTREAC